MTALKVLPARPSQDSLRKQAKKLSREVAAGNVEALGRVRAQIDSPELPLTQRDAQLVIAREYGFAGWQQLIAEVERRAGNSFAWALAQARRIVHDNDVEALRQLVSDHPALLAWRDEGGLLAFATYSFGDSGDENREKHYTRAECAELLLDAGAVVMPEVCQALLDARANNLLRMFERRGLLPRTLPFRIALGDMAGVRALLANGAVDRVTLQDALRRACLYENEPMAVLLLERLIALDPELGRRIDGGPGRLPFLRYLIEHRWLDFMHVTPEGPWQAFVMQRIVRSIHDRDIAAFTSGLRLDAWLLSDACVDFQVGLVERATLHGQGAYIEALFDLEPALLRRRPPPPSQALGFAFTYAHAALLPLLLRVWSLPDDLPHAAGIGDMERVKTWFDASGEPALGDLQQHFPCNSAYARGNLQWGAPTAQQVLDTALAWSVLNHHFAVADFLLAHGANINTDWSSHEPASILHELTGHDDYAAMQFLIDRGIDMTIKDYRWNGTAAGWAYYAANNEKLSNWLIEMEQRRKNGA